MRRFPAQARAVFVASAALSCLAACNTTGTSMQAETQAPAASFAAPEAARPAREENAAPAVSTLGQDYRVVSDDVLDVTVYQVADLSRSVTVDGAGFVQLPLIGPVRAAGRPLREIEAEISRRLGAKYLQNPQVSVAVKDAVGMRVTVDGAVNKPGVQTARGELTLLRVVAEAQGFKDTADLGNVVVFRTTAQGRSAAVYDVASIRSGRAPDPRIYGGDTVIVDDSGTRIAWKAVRETLPLAGLFARLL